VFLFDPLRGEDWREWWETHDERIAEGLLSIGVILIALIVIHFVVRQVLKRTLSRVVSRAEHRKRGVDPEAIRRRAGTLETTFAWGLDIVLFAVGAGLVLGELGFNVTALVAGFGIVGIAVGFGAQTFVKDVINGFFILAEDQYRIGDVIKVGDVTGAGVAGVVEDINPRRTVLRDLDGNVHFVPNSAIVVATNMTMDFSRINLNVGVAYKEDLERVIPIINDVCDGLMRDFPNAMAVPPSVFRVDALGDSSVDIKVLGDVRIGEQWAMMGELRRRIKNRFDAEGIEIPYPHRTVFTRDGVPLGASPAVVAADSAEGD
jgi:small conductance mechanosensitive channel